MKRFGLILPMAAGLLLFFAAATAEAQPAFYIDFDDHPAGAYDRANEYIFDSSADVFTSITTLFFERMPPTGDGGVGVEIKVPNGDGTTAPSSAGPQGGQAMVIESGGFEEGISAAMTSPYWLGDLTIEVVFWTTSNNLSGNTVGLQNLIGADWPDVAPNGQHFSGVLRILGDGAPVSRPGDSQKLEWVGWQATSSTGNERQCNSINVINPGQWYTAAGVFDYNESDPANSRMALYLDGVLQEEVVFDANSGANGVFDRRWGVFGTPADGSFAVDDPAGVGNNIGRFRFAIGCSHNRMINGSDNRGLDGAIDAVAISLEALGPGTFVLPTGYTPPQPLESTSWQMFE